MNARLLVRCCCNPTKILGSLPMDIGSALFAVETFSTYFRASDALICEARTNPAAASLLRESLYKEQAFKSDDAPIEALRRIPEFVEAPANLNRFDYVCPYCFGDLRTCPCGDKPAPVEKPR